MRRRTSRLSNVYIPQPLYHRSDGLLWRNNNDNDTDTNPNLLPHILPHRKINDTTSSSSSSSSSSSTSNYQRKTHELRPLRIESHSVGVVPTSSLSNPYSYISGSAYMELGRTKVLCTVIGPISSNSPTNAVSSSLSSSLSNHNECDGASIHVDVSYLGNHASYPSHHVINHPNIRLTPDMTSTATASKKSHGSNSQNSNSSTTPSNHHSHRNQNGLLNPKQCHTWIQDQETNLAIRIQQILSPMIRWELYPKCTIRIQLMIWYNDDANIITTCLHTAILALCQAQIELYHIVTTSTVAILTVPSTKDRGEIVLRLADPTMEEMLMADSIITMGMVISSAHHNRNTDEDDHNNDDDNDNEIVLWEQSTLYHPNHHHHETSSTAAAIDLCFDGCRTMYQFLRQHLLQSSLSTTTTTTASSTKNGHPYYQTGYRDQVEHNDNNDNPQVTTQLPYHHHMTKKRSRTEKIF